MKVRLFFGFEPFRIEYHFIDVNWTGKGELEGYDSDGNYYELEVD
jgi:hypothetical protein